VSAPHHVAKESKLHPSGLYTERSIKRGYGRSRRKFGVIQSFVKKREGQVITIAWIFRRTDQLFVSDKTWAVETSTLEALSPYGVSHIGILVEDGEKLLIRKSDLQKKEIREAKGIVLRDFSDAKGAAPGAEGKVGMRQYHIPVAAFARLVPPRDESEAARMKLIYMKGRGTGTRAPVKPEPKAET
jgi:hypothetical protein